MSEAVRGLSRGAVAVTCVLGAALPLQAGAMDERRVAEGYLEQGEVYSRIYEVSSESGDLIVHVFPTKSRAGASILDRCLPGLVCSVDASAVEYLDDDALRRLRLEWEEGASAMFLIQQVADAYMQSNLGYYQTEFETRHGWLTIDEEYRLLFNGRLVADGVQVSGTMEVVQGNSSLAVVADYQAGSSDVVLLQSAGGAGCPALFRFATLTADGIAVTPEFGTCSDIVHVAPDRDRQSLIVQMPGFAGPFSEEAEQLQAMRQKHVFRFRNGEVAEVP
jgi:hypothetical protein